jgi:hypothetical protein
MATVENTKIFGTATAIAASEAAAKANTTASLTTAAATNTKIISGVANPKTQIYSDIRNSINGRGSLNSSNVHVNSIQQNIARAISVSKEFSDAPALTALQNAQKYMATASGAKDVASRNAALASAKAELITANNTMANQGYGKIISTTTKPSISTANNKIVL